jgi:ABC-type uncharacterized transport system permease subunit
LAFFASFSQRRLSERGIFSGQIRMIADEQIKLFFKRAPLFLLSNVIFYISFTISLFVFAVGRAIRESVFRIRARQLFFMPGISCKKG